MSLPAETRLGAVHLTVTNLDRSLAFYQQSLGFTLYERQGAMAWLGGAAADGAAAGRPFLVLHENPQARSAQRTTGLYHFAVLTPNRQELAQALRCIAATRTPVQGFADHLLREAIYLPDPDGNGIEIYRDRPRSEWQRGPGGELRMASDPLDVDDLLAELHDQPDEWGGLPADTVLGHMHLHVRQIAEAEHFTNDVLGFDRVLRYGSSASFSSAGGYHHHIGMNTWNGAGALPPPPGSTGLRWFEVLLPDQGGLDAALERLDAAGLAPQEHPDGLLVHDPSQNGILLRVDDGH